jgi:hypothetical protein
LFFICHRFLSKISLDKNTFPYQLSTVVGADGYPYSYRHID